MIGMIIGAGGGHGDGSINWFEIGALVVNFVVLLLALPAILRNLTGRSPKEHLQHQREEMAAQLKDAEEKQAAAEKRLEEYAKKLSNLEKEVQEIMESYQAQAEADETKVKAEAELKIERMIRDADFTINQESLKAQREIREAAIETTLSMTQSLFAERITDADRRRLADEYIGNIAKN